MIYVVFDELGREPTEEYMADLGRKIREVDLVQGDMVTVCLNNSAIAAVELAALDMNDPKNWGRLKIVMIPREGEIKGYFPRRFLEEFKTLSDAKRTSYEVFSEILGDGGDEF